jgi:hypothetical protein
MSASAESIIEPVDGFSRLLGGNLAKICRFEAGSVESNCNGRTALIFALVFAFNGF